MTELKDVETPTIEYAERRGFEYRKVKWVGRRGAPDNLFGDPTGQQVPPFFVEFKAPGKKPRRDQWREIHGLRAWGFRVYVIDTAAKGRALIDAKRESTP